MSDMNRIQLSGRVARTEMKFTSNGTAVLEIGVANSQREKANGEWKDTTSFYNVKAYGQTAENLNKFVAKGKTVIVGGSLKARPYANKEGQPAVALEITVQNTNDVNVVYTGQAANSANAAAAPAPVVAPVAPGEAPTDTDDIPF